MSVKQSKRFLWFFFLWIAGVSLLGTIAMIIKAIIL
jgi:hypothetical protein